MKVLDERAAAAAMLLVVGGCAAIEPNSVRIYGEHVSHASQHFGSDPTSYGYDSLNLELHYQHRGLFLDVAEGIVLNSKDTKVSGDCYGGLWGPREVFTARAGYEFPFKP